MSYEKIIADNKAWIDEVFAKLDKKLSRTAVKSRNIIPYTTKDGQHDDKGAEYIHGWTNGFWGGLMWLMYEATGNEDYKLTAIESEKMMDKCFESMETLHHDVGFMWHIMAGANYRLTGDMAARNKNILAAMTLAARYNVEGDYIRSWNGKWDDNGGRQCWTIIDCMMNIPQLYWASREIDDTRFKKIAIRYADMAMRDHVRPDGSVNHIVVHDSEKPDTVIETKGGQGYGVGSCWSRGDAWALYGFILSYIHTKEERYLDTAKKVAQYFITNVASTDWLPLCDFRAPESPVYYDSTAGAIAACGIIEIAKHVPEFEKDIYLSAAVKMLKAMEAAWCNWEENEDAVLMMGTERYVLPDGKGAKGLHIPIIYGDYFFTEAILKLRGSEFLPW